MKRTAPISKPTENIGATERESLLRRSVTDDISSDDISSDDISSDDISSDDISSDDISSDDISSINPNGESHGFEDLVAHIEQFQKQRPGATFTIDKFLTHHDQFFSEWTMFSKDGSAAATGDSYGRFDAGGLIAYLIGFF